MSFVPAIAPTVATAWPQAARAARPAQRIDHFLVHTDAKLKATTAERCFTEPCVKAKGGKLDVTLSDHYGIRATLRRA